MTDKENPEAAMMRAFRAELGLMQREVAKALGVNLTTVNRWENGAQALAMPTVMALAMIGLTMVQAKDWKVTPQVRVHLDNLRRIAGELLS